MKYNTPKDTVTVLGIDLAKNSFHLYGINENGSTVLSKKLTRAKLAAFIAQMPVCLIGIEACGGANYWKRVFERYGHTVKMMSPQFVKPYVNRTRTM